MTDALYPTLLFCQPAARGPGSYVPDTETKAQGSNDLRDGFLGILKTQGIMSNLTLEETKL